MLAAGVIAVGTLLSLSAIGTPSRPIPLHTPVFAQDLPRDMEEGDSLNHCQSAHVISAGGQNINLIVGDGLNVGAGPNHGCLTPQNEPSIAVNPTNPLNLVAGANDYRDCCSINDQGEKRNDGGGYAFYSFDGGLSWQNVKLPHLTSLNGGAGVLSLVNSGGDPVVTFAPDGTVYYANIVFARVGNASGVVVSKSIDGGKTWSDPSIVAFTNTSSVFNDKEWVGVGPHGRLVVSWTRFQLDSLGSYVSSPIVYRSSFDGGKTWKPMRQVAAKRPYAQGSVIQFTPQGKLCIAFETVDKTNTKDVTVVAEQNTNGTFSLHELGQVFDGLNAYPTNADQRETLSGEDFRINSFPQFSIDPVTGHFFIVWADDQLRSAGMAYFTGITSAQVKLVTSTDGRHFSAPRFVTKDAPDKVYPAVAALNGHVVISYLTRAYAQDKTALDLAAKSSVDGFSKETRVSDVSMDPYMQFAGAFIGDYTAIALGSDGIAHPVWVDTRNANQDIFTAQVK